MLRILPEKMNIPYMSIRLPMVAISLILVVASLFLVSTKGLNYGVDFAGGIQMLLRFSPETGMDAERLRSGLDRLGFNASVQNFGTQFQEVEATVGGQDVSARPREFMVNFSADFVDPEENQELLQQAFAGYQESAAEPVIAAFRFSGMERAFFSLRKDIPFAEIEKVVGGIQFKLLELESVQAFGPARNREYELKFRDVSSKLLDRVANEFQLKVGEGVSLEKVDFVGARVGQDLKWAAIWSTIISLFLIFLYIFIRFDLNYAPGAILATTHDVIVTVGIFSWLGLEFDLTTVAALLTLAGYSVNDTIVIFDRVRELVAEYKGKKMVDIINMALNQTMSRTIITSLTVLMATAILWVFGGPVIHGFAFALSFGVIAGSYSTIFVASAMLLWISEWSEKREGKSKSKAAAA